MEKSKNAPKSADEYIHDHWLKNQIWTHLDAPKHQHRLRRCADLISIGASSVVDIGCACGHSTSIMKKFAPNHQWFGIDFSKIAIETADATFKEIIFLYYPTIEEIELQFDCVICSEVIEHVPDPVLFLSNLLRISDNKVILTTPNHFVNDPGHVRLYTEKTFAEDLAAAGAKEFSIHSIGEFFFATAMK
jgi:2-polyprenyl-3-methyl-5-hydroxy-6-metoxy-1,4-benzoquinol methylase